MTGRMEGRIRGTKRRLCGAALSPPSRAGGSAQSGAGSQWAAQSSPSCFFPCIRTREKQEPSASRNVTPSCAGRAPCHTPSPAALCIHCSCTQGRWPLSTLGHLAAAGHRRALCPLQNSWAGICGVGGDRQTSGPFPHRAGGW